MRSLAANPSGTAPVAHGGASAVHATTASRTEPARVTVVLPIRNEAEHIEACLERLLRQDYPQDRMEILVVDGLSEDGTAEVVARCPEAAPRR